jgi:hypothetical protein
MDQRLARILQVVSLVMLAWFAYSWLAKLHWVLGGALCFFAVANAATAWMIRERWAFLPVAVRVGILRRYVLFVCSCMGEQLPSSGSVNGSGSGLQLRSQRDFHVAGEQARQIVRGHDEVINRVLTRIHENVTLRKRQRRGSQKGPLAAFLLVGPDGVGKRYLTRVLAKLLYSDGAVDVFGCDRIVPSFLVGVNGSPGELLELARKDPHRMILFEHIDRASAEVVHLLTQLVTSGTLRAPGSNTTVSFENTTIVFTTTSAVDVLAGMSDNELAVAAWQQRAVERIAEDTQIDDKLLNGVTELMYCEAPDDQAKCEIVALLMQKECGDHRTELSHVDPEIIATQVLQVDDEQGFALAQQSIKKLLRKPLVVAASGDHESLALRVRLEPHAFPE